MSTTGPLISGLHRTNFLCVTAIAKTFKGLLALAIDPADAFLKRIYTAFPFIQKISFAGVTGMYPLYHNFNTPVEFNPPDGCII